MPLSQLEEMEQDEKIATLQQYRAAYTIKDLSAAWGLTNPIQYYMWLKKHRIYEQLVRRADKFEPSKEWRRLNEGEGRGAGFESERIRGLSADQFRYALDTDSTGPELAHVFRRLAEFLLNEKGQFRCRIELKAVAQPASAKEWKDEEAGA